MICLLLRYQVESLWEVDGAVYCVLDEQLPLTNWQAMVEIVRARFPKRLLPNMLYEDARLARGPFHAVVCDCFYALLGYLDAYMRGRDSAGNEAMQFQEILRTHLQ